MDVWANRSDQFFRGVLVEQDRVIDDVKGADQRKATLKNLRQYYGDAFRSKYYFTKWADGKQPSYITCEVADECTRVEFKSQTRAYAEKKFKVKIIANFGDQFSDLIGGHGKPVKLPNPTYYLP